ncbi:MAG TPA: hypothetical protein VMH26_08610 [Burkholderiales bacterium]|nr:hypothetical protein [Burkholderiales bacterium]
MRPLAVLSWLVFLAASAGGARAADWDHDANISGGVEALVAAYRAGGIDFAAGLSRACYASIDGAGEPDVQLQRLEYCAGIDFSGYLLDRRDAEANGTPRSEFFSSQMLMLRLEKLEEFIPDPGAQQRILRAWGSATADALQKQLQ